MSGKHDTDTVCEACDFEPFVKNNYFTGKMMGAADFIAETRYHSEKCGCTRRGCTAGGSSAD